MRNLSLVFAACVAMGLFLFVGVGAALAAETGSGLPTLSTSFTCTSDDNLTFGSPTCRCSGAADCIKMAKSCKGDAVCNGEKCKCDWNMPSVGGGMSVLRPMIQSGGGATLAPVPAKPTTAKPMVGRIIAPSSPAVLAPVAPKPANPATITPVTPKPGTAPKPNASDRKAPTVRRPVIAPGSRAVIAPKDDCDGDENKRKKKNKRRSGEACK